MGFKTFSSSSSNKTINDRSHILTFGKYKGQSIEEIMEYDANYLLFLHNNNGFFNLHYELLDEVEEKANGGKKHDADEEFYRLNCY